MRRQSFGITAAARASRRPRQHQIAERRVGAAKRNLRYLLEKWIERLARRPVGDVADEFSGLLHQIAEKLLELLFVPDAEQFGGELHLIRASVTRPRRTERRTSQCYELLHPG
jgi:hypothetical protein